jgi:hypothetical protein
MFGIYSQYYKFICTLHKLEDNTNYYVVLMEFLEKLNSQNRIIWKNQIKQEKKLDKINQILRKMCYENALAPAFFEVSENLWILLSY